MEKSLKERNSSLELLRIIGIFFIILRHYCENVIPFADITTANWSWRIIFLQVNTAWGMVANNIFTLISGYFMISKKVNWKRIVCLIAEMFFYSWIIMIILYGFRISSFSIGDMIKQLIPVWFGETWYVNCYIVFCCFLPFINPFLDGLSKENYKKFLVVFFLIACVARTFLAETFIGFWQSVDHFVFMFALGGYIKKYGIVSTIHWKFVFLCSIMLISLSVIVLSCGGMLLNINKLVGTSALYFTSGDKILCVIASVSLFLWVINIKPFHNKRINSLSRSVLGVFLIHFNPLLRGVLWYKISPNADYINTNAIVLHCIIKVSIIFIVCFIIDQIRILTIDKVFRQFIDKHWDKYTARAKSICCKLGKLVPFE